MRIRGVVWLREIVDKLAVKHHVAPHEVEEMLANTNQFRFLEKGERPRRGCVYRFGTVGRRSILSGTFHIQENERSIDPQCPRYGSQGKKTVWQKIKQSAFRD